MARPDQTHSQGAVLPFVSRKTQAADSVPPTHVSSADPHPPTTTMNPFHDQAPVPTDGHFYSLYPELYGFSNTGHGDATAAGGRNGSLAAGFSAMCETEGYPQGWEYDALSNVEMAFLPSTPGIAQGEEGHGTQPQASWDYGVQRYSAMAGDQMALADPMSQYIPVEDSMGGCFESANWSQSQMEHVSPSPSLSSYYTSSPASNCLPKFSRHNSWSSLPASRAAAAEQTRFDARFQPVPEQAVSPVERRLTPGGTVTNGGFYIVPESQSSVKKRTFPPLGLTRNQTIKAKPTATLEKNTGTLSPAFTPSPESVAPAASIQPKSQPVRRAPDEQTAKNNGKKALQPARQATHKKDVAAERSQGQSSHSRAAPPPPPPPQQKQQQRKAQPVQRTRNRDAANKCRAKTKVAVADLQETERELGTEHRELSTTARCLRDEVLRLKNDLLAHGNCDDAVIQQYLTNQARIVGSGEWTAHNQPQQRPQQQQHQHHHHHHHHHDHNQDQEYRYQQQY